MDWSAAREQVLRPADRALRLLRLVPGASFAPLPLQSELRALVEQLKEQTDVDLTGTDVRLSLFFGAGARASRPYAGIVRGVAGLPERGDAAGSRAPDARGVRTLQVGGTQVAWRSDIDFAWAYPARDVVVFGNRRGIKRQLHHRHKGPANDSQIALLARKIRRPGLLRAVLLKPQALLESWRGETRASAALRDVRHLRLVLDDTTLRVVAGTAGSAEQKAMRELMRAQGRLIEGNALLVAGAGHRLLSLHASGRQPPAAVADLEPEALRQLLDEHLDGFNIEQRVRTRASGAVTAEWRGNSGVGTWVGAVLTLAEPGGLPAREALRAEAQRLLLQLRRVQWYLARRQGGYRACGPTPAEPPTRAVPWPSAGCFALLRRGGHRGDIPVRIQLQARVDAAGKLKLIARTDPDGDGVPFVWWLDEASSQLRRLGLQPQTASE